ncbi:MAG: glutamate synthase subunit beta [Lachnospiraceae bacterium]|nr:glutamate synthase subunit beta [Lachnospiraceae bacterium]
MGKATGFLEVERKDAAIVEPLERVKNFEEFHGKLTLEEQRAQASRCMECGIPFCQAGVFIAGMASGCPLHNLVPEVNDLVYKGNLEQAYVRLSKTHSFPEFTSRVCPALCEAACTCGLHNAPVTTKANEKTVIEYAYEKGLVKEEVGASTGRKIAIVGSGPSGLAAAQLLNRRGHDVTVFERSDRIGGLLRYGIPNMKLDKRVIDRRIKLMEDAGVKFICNTNVGKDIKPEKLLKEYDRVILACGASNPRDVKAEGRDAKGIYFAVDFLKEVSKNLIDLEYDSDKLIAKKDFSFGSLKGKNVVVIGGGDTGNDCVGTSLRLGAANVVQLEMMPKPSEERLPSNPWPEWPKVLKTDYGQEEVIALFGNDPRLYTTTVKEYVKDAKGNLKAVKTVQIKMEKDKNGKMSMVNVPGSEKEIKCDLCLIAAGFLGCEGYVANGFGVECNERTNIKTEEGHFETSKKNVFATGDARRGQSLVVWAIAEGRAVAKEVDESLMGYSNL